MTIKRPHPRHFFGDSIKQRILAAVSDWVTPVPGGVGPVTVAILMRNAVLAHQRQLQSIWREVG